MRAEVEQNRSEHPADRSGIHQKIKGHSQAGHERELGSRGVEGLEMGDERGRERVVEARLFECMTYRKDRGNEDEQGKIDFFEGVKRQRPPAGQIAEEHEAQAHIDRMDAVHRVRRPHDHPGDENAEHLFLGSGDPRGHIRGRATREIGLSRRAKQQRDEAVEQGNAQQADDGKKIIRPRAPIDREVARFEYAEDDQIGHAGRQNARAAVIRGASQGQDEARADL